jgi:hypothetical protein
MNLRLRAATLALVGLLGLAAAAPPARAQAASNEALGAEAVSRLQAALADRRVVADHVARLAPQLKAEYADSLTQHLHQQFNDARTKARLRSLLAPAVKPGDAQEQLTNHLIDALSEARLPGLARADDESVATFVTWVTGMHESMPHEYCKRSLAGQLTARQGVLIEWFWASHLPLDSFESMLALNATLSMAALGEQPAVRTLTPAQESRAQAVYRAALAKRIDALPDPQAAYAALKSPDGVEPALYCEAMLQTSKAALEVEGADRAAVLAVFAREFRRKK